MLEPARILPCLLFVSPVLGQTWSRTLADTDTLVSVIELSSGEVVVLGSTFSPPAVLLDSTGTPVWARATPIARLGKLCRTAADEIAVVGGNGEGARISALDATGTDLWGRDLDGYEWYAVGDLDSVETTADGGMIATGCEWDTLGDTTATRVFRLDATGAVLWARRLGASAANASGIELSDGSILVAAFDFYHCCVDSLRIFKFDASGNLLSYRVTGQAPYTWSFPRLTERANGDIVLVYGGGAPDVLELSAIDGSVIRHRRFPGSYRDITATRDGGFVIVGSTIQFAGPDEDLHIVKCDDSGDIEWQYRYGGPEWEEAHAVTEAANGDLLVAGGATNSLDGLFLRMDATGRIAGCPGLPTWGEPETVSWNWSDQTTSNHVESTDTTAAGGSVSIAVPLAVDVCLGADVGARYCAPAVPNSTGSPGEIWAAGSTTVADERLVLAASSLPVNQFGYFLTGQSNGTSQPPGTQGNLCLVGGKVHRYAAWVSSTASVGTLGLEIDVNAIPGHGAIQPGETWNFQCWFRDQNPSQTSNFTDAVGIAFL